MSQAGLSSSERRRLRKLLHGTTDARLYRRLLAILEVDRGQPVSEVARMLGVSCQTIYNWISRFESDAHAGALADRQRMGRPSLWAEERIAFLQSLLESPPDRLGYFANEWAVPLLKQQLEHWSGKHFSQDTIRRQLHRLGYVWKRSRYVLAPDPELEKKTRNSPKNQAFAGSQRSAGGRRNRPAAVSAAQGRLVAAR
jgi:transposase